MVKALILYFVFSATNKYIKLKIFLDRAELKLKFLDGTSHMIFEVLSSIYENELGSYLDIFLVLYPLKSLR